MVVDGSILVSICVLVLAVLVASMASEMVVDRSIWAYNALHASSSVHGLA